MEVATIPAQRNLSTEIYTNPEKFELAQRVARVLSECTLFPAHFRGPDNLANCFVAMQLCNRIGEDPFLVMQKMYVVNGRLGIESQLAIAMMNKSGFFRDRIKYRHNGKTGDDYGWIAYATDQQGNLCEEECTIGIAKKKGWWTKDKSNWPPMFDLMCKYRAAMFVGRLHCPEALMGMATVDELKDIGEAEVIDSPLVSSTRPRLSAADLDKALDGNPEPVEAETVLEGQIMPSAEEMPAEAIETAIEPSPTEAELRAWAKGLDAEGKKKLKELIAKNKDTHGDGVDGARAAYHYMNMQEQ